MAGLWVVMSSSCPVMESGRYATESRKITGVTLLLYEIKSNLCSCSNWAQGGSDLKLYFESWLVIYVRQVGGLSAIPRGEMAYQRNHWLSHLLAVSADKPRTDYSMGLKKWFWAHCFGSMGGFLYAVCPRFTLTVTFHSFKFHWAAAVVPGTSAPSVCLGRQAWGRCPAGSCEGGLPAGGSPADSAAIRQWVCQIRGTSGPPTGMLPKAAWQLCLGSKKARAIPVGQEIKFTWEKVFIK